MTEQDWLRRSIEEWRRWLQHLGDEKSQRHWQESWQRLGQQLAEQGLRWREDEASIGQSYRRWQSQLKAERPWLNHYAGWIDWRSNQSGLKRLAHFMAALLRMHLQGLEQYPCLRGSLHKSASASRCGRHVLILWQGRAYRLAASDGQGLPATPVQIENTLYQLLQEALPSEEDLPFTAFSHLPEKRFQEMKGRLRQNEHNRRIWEACQEALFSLCVDVQHQNESQDSLAAAAFSDGTGFFAHKPISYRGNINDQRYSAHSESTYCNPLQLAQCLQRAQELFEQDAPRRNDLPPDLGIQRLQWQLTAEQESQLLEHWQDYQRETEKLTVSGCDLFLSADDHALLLQHQPPLVLLLVFQYAHRRSKKRGGCHVFHDLSQQQSIHLLSPEAQALLDALMEGRENIEALWYAYTREQERRQNLQPPPSQMLLFLQEYLQQKRLKINLWGEDFGLHWPRDLEIVRMTGQQKIKNIAFVPAAEGIALSYAIQRNNISILMTHYRNKWPDIQRYVQELKYACKDVLRRLAAITPD